MIGHVVQNSPSWMANGVVGHKNKEMTAIHMLIPLFFDAPLRHLPSSVVDFVPCDQFMQRAYFLLHNTGGPNNAKQGKNPNYCTILDAISFTLQPPKQPVSRLIFHSFMLTDQSVNQIVLACLIIFVRSRLV